MLQLLINDDYRPSSARGWKTTMLEGIYKYLQSQPTYTRAILAIGHTPNCPLIIPTLAPNCPLPYAGTWMASLPMRRFKCKHMGVDLYF